MGKSTSAERMAALRTRLNWLARHIDPDVNTWERLGTKWYRAHLKNNVLTTELAAARQVVDERIAVMGAALEAIACRSDEPISAEMAADALKRVKGK